MQVCDFCKAAVFKGDAGEIERVPDRHAIVYGVSDGECYVEEDLPVFDKPNRRLNENYLVRVYVARRLHVGLLFKMICDPDRQVRMEVALRLPVVSLAMLANDADEEVRRVVVERIDPAGAVMLLDDPSWIVRLRAVEKVPLHTLNRMLTDPEKEVRDAVMRRLHPNENLQVL